MTQHQFINDSQNHMVQNVDQDIQKNQTLQENTNAHNVNTNSNMDVDNADTCSIASDKDYTTSNAESNDDFYDGNILNFLYKTYCICNIYIN